MAGKQVLVLGGGMGGVVAANRLRRLLNREHRVILIDRTIWHSLPFTYPWLMLNWRKTSRVTRDLRSLNRKGIELRAAEITRLDLDNKRVELGEERLDYDYLVVALGASMALAASRAWAAPGRTTPWRARRASRRSCRVSGRDGSLLLLAERLIGRRARRMRARSPWITISRSKSSVRRLRFASLLRRSNR